MPYLTVQEIETIAERIVRAYHRYCAQQNQTVTRIDPEIVTSNVLGLQIVYHKLSRFGHVLGLTCMLPVQIQELREAEPEMLRPRKERAAEREDGIDYAPAESRGKTKRIKDTMKEERAEDLQRARSDMYSAHENVAYNMKKVPIWEKYALSLSEAAEYFHIGTRRLRQIIAKDKYAKYLIWNGGRVFFKRKMFEEYLNNEVQLFSNNNTES